MDKLELLIKYIFMYETNLFMISSFNLKLNKLTNNLKFINFNNN
jgi:hypothetical protein